MTWGLGSDPEALIFDAIFEMHEDASTDPSCRDAFQMLTHASQPVYMQQCHPDVPMSLRFPLEDVDASVFSGVPEHQRYGSSGAYMLALAIHLGYKRIGLFGFDVSEDRYGDQKANLAHLVGFARGRGVEVHLPEACEVFSLGEMNIPGRELRYETRYGVIDHPA